MKEKLIYVWRALWALIAWPLGMGIVLCALIGVGPKRANEWAEEQRLRFW